ncbi:MAG: ester cyclase [Verrucomicrobia bacterium]|nr:ester cyclase [Prolixibacteraceae bacterium]
MNDQRQLVEQFMEAIANHDYPKIREMLHDEYTYESSDGQRMEGPEAGIARYEMLTSAFPDLHMDIRNMFVDGNTIVSEFINHGTHQGEMNGIEPTYHPIALPSCNIIEIRDGKIYADRDYYDNALMMHQLGVVLGREQTV